MDTSELNPIIFIPGLMGSIGGEILGCEIEWSFGAASWFYRPFIKELEQFGYVLNENLFVCYYDWRKSCREIVKEFLIPLLLQVEKKWVNKKIDLLCHSMGGIVGRTYIQGIEYSNNIRNIMCFGTPNKGNVEAYYLWSTGNIMKQSNKEKDLFDIIRRSYIWLLTKLLEIPLGSDTVEELRRNFKGLGDLIPSDDYGEMLCYKEGEVYKYIPIKYNIYKNQLLNELNKNSNSLYGRIENIYCFVGNNNETDKSLILDKELLFKYRKGFVTGTLTTTAGDGTVTMNSAKIDNAETFVIDGSHTGILVKAIKHIANIYNLDRRIVDGKEEEFAEYPLGIILNKNVNAVIKNQRGIVGKLENGKFITEHECICQEFKKDYIWIMFKNIPKGEYRLEAFSQEENSNIFIISPLIEEELKPTHVEKAIAKAIQFSFKV